MVLSYQMFGTQKNTKIFLEVTYLLPSVYNSSKLYGQIETILIPSNRYCKYFFGFRLFYGKTKILKYHYNIHHRPDLKNH